MSKIAVYCMVLTCFIAGFPGMGFAKSPTPVADAAATAPITFRQDSLSITTSVTKEMESAECPLDKPKCSVRQKIHFTIEIADTPEKQAFGLMGRSSMKKNHGMLFIAKKDESITDMWMKDTLIPLDMLFIDEDGTILFIARNTTPNSKKPINAGRPVHSVLELVGGTVDKHQIMAGDKVIHPFFTK